MRQSVSTSATMAALTVLYVSEALSIVPARSSDGAEWHQESVEYRSSWFQLDLLSPEYAKDIGYERLYAESELVRLGQPGPPGLSERVPLPDAMGRLGTRRTAILSASKAQQSALLDALLRRIDGRGHTALPPYPYGLTGDPLADDFERFFPAPQQDSGNGPSVQRVGRSTQSVAPPLCVVQVDFAKCKSPADLTPNSSSGCTSLRPIGASPASQQCADSDSRQVWVGQNLEGIRSRELRSDLSKAFQSRAQRKSSSTGCKDGRPCYGPDTVAYLLTTEPEMAQQFADWQVAINRGIDEPWLEDYVRANLRRTKTRPDPHSVLEAMRTNRRLKEVAQEPRLIPTIGSFASPGAPDYRTSAWGLRAARVLAECIQAEDGQSEGDAARLLDRLSKLAARPYPLDGCALPAYDDWLASRADIERVLCYDESEEECGAHVWSCLEDSILSVAKSAPTASEDQFRFTVLAFQEFLAARHFAAELASFDNDKETARWKAIWNRTYDVRWREVRPILCGLVGDRKREFALSAAIHVSDGAWDVPRDAFGTPALAALECLSELPPDYLARSTGEGLLPVANSFRSGDEVAALAWRTMAKSPKVRGALLWRVIPSLADRYRHAVRRLDSVLPAHVRPSRIIDELDVTRTLLDQDKLERPVQDYLLDVRAEKLPSLMEALDYLGSVGEADSSVGLPIIEALLDHAERGFYETRRVETLGVLGSLRSLSSFKSAVEARRAREWLLRLARVASDAGTPEIRQAATDAWLRHCERHIELCLPAEPERADWVKWYQETPPTEGLEVRRLIGALVAHMQRHDDALRSFGEGLERHYRADFETQDSRSPRRGSPAPDRVEILNRSAIRSQLGIVGAQTFVRWDTELSRERAQPLLDYFGKVLDASVNDPFRDLLRTETGVAACALSTTADPPTAAWQVLRSSLATADERGRERNYSVLSELPCDRADLTPLHASAALLPLSDASEVRPQPSLLSKLLSALVEEDEDLAAAPPNLQALRRILERGVELPAVLVSLGFRLDPTELIGSLTRAEQKPDVIRLLSWWPELWTPAYAEQIVACAKDADMNDARRSACFWALYHQRSRIEPFGLSLPDLAEIYLQAANDNSLAARARREAFALASLIVDWRSLGRMSLDPTQNLIGLIDRSFRSVQDENEPLLAEFVIYDTSVRQHFVLRTEGSLHLLDAVCPEQDAFGFLGANPLGEALALLDGGKAYQAIQLMRPLLPDPDSESICTLQNRDLAVVYAEALFRIGRHRDAAKFANSAAKACSKLGDAAHRHILHLTNTSSNSAAQLGNYQDSIDVARDGVVWVQVPQQWLDHAIHGPPIPAGESVSPWQPLPVQAEAIESLAFRYSVAASLHEDTEFGRQAGTAAQNLLDSLIQQYGLLRRVNNCPQLGDSDASTAKFTGPNADADPHAAGCDALVPAPSVYFRHSQAIARNGNSADSKATAIRAKEALRIVDEGLQSLEASDSPAAVRLHAEMLDWKAVLLHEYLDDSENAYQHERRARELVPEDSTFAANLADIEFALARYPDAAQHISDAISQFGADEHESRSVMSLYLLLAECLSEEGQRYLTDERILKLASDVWRERHDIPGRPSWTHRGVERSLGRIIEANGETSHRAKIARAGLELISGFASWHGAQARKAGPALLNLVEGALTVHNAWSPAPQQFSLGIETGFPDSRVPVLWAKFSPSALTPPAGAKLELRCKATATGEEGHKEIEIFRKLVSVSRVEWSERHSLSLGNAPSVLREGGNIECTLNYQMFGQPSNVAKSASLAVPRPPTAWGRVRAFTRLYWHWALAMSLLFSVLWLLFPASSWRRRRLRDLAWLQSKDNPFDSRITHAISLPSDLIGREDLLERLVRYLTVREKAAWVLLVGRAGIGKTSILRVIEHDSGPLVGASSQSMSFLPVYLSLGAFRGDSPDDANLVMHWIACRVCKSVRETMAGQRAEFSALHCDRVDGVHYTGSNLEEDIADLDGDLQRMQASASPENGHRPHVRIVLLIDEGDCLARLEKQGSMHLMSLRQMAQDNLCSIVSTFLVNPTDVVPDVSSCFRQIQSLKVEKLNLDQSRSLVTRVCEEMRVDEPAFEHLWSSADEGLPYLLALYLKHLVDDCRARDSTKVQVEDVARVEPTVAWHLNLLGPGRTVPRRELLQLEHSLERLANLRSENRGEEGERNQLRDEVLARIEELQKWAAPSALPPAERYPDHEGKE